MYFKYTSQGIFNIIVKQLMSVGEHEVCH